MRRDKDDLRAFRGMAFGLPLGALAWALLVGALVLLAGCATDEALTRARLLLPAGPFRVGNMTIVVTDAARAAQLCAALIGQERRAGCWKRQGAEHLVVTDRDSLTLVHELLHVEKGNWHP